MICQRLSFVEQCHKLRECLHRRDKQCVDVFDDIRTHYTERVENETTSSCSGEVGQFLTNYVQQVECLLHIIRAYRQGEWEDYLAALDDQIKYFFAQDLYNYARLMLLHLAQMNQLKRERERESPETSKALKEGDVCVKKTGTPFTNLFVDQTLE